MGLKKQYIHFKNWVAVTAKKAYLEIKRDALLIAFGFVCTIAKAQTDAGSGAISTAAQTISRYQEPVQKLMYAIAAVIGIIGAFSVYFKMQNGDQDVKKTIMLTIGGCVAFIAMSEALPMFFK